MLLHAQVATSAAVPARAHSSVPFEAISWTEVQMSWEESVEHQVSSPDFAFCATNAEAHAEYQLLQNVLEYCLSPPVPTCEHFVQRELQMQMLSLFVIRSYNVQASVCPGCERPLGHQHARATQQDAVVATT